VYQIYVESMDIGVIHALLQPCNSYPTVMRNATF